MGGNTAWSPLRDSVESIPHAGCGESDSQAISAALLGFTDRSRRTVVTIGSTVPEQFLQGLGSRLSRRSCRLGLILGEPSRIGPGCPQFLDVHPLDA